MRVEALAQVAQRSCGCPIPGIVQGQVGQGFSNLVWWKASLAMKGGLD